jgi:putative peptidoglycan lipid II flippase
MVNIAGSLILFFIIGHVGIAIATSLAAWTNALLLGTTLLRRKNFEPDANLRRRAALIALASVVMGAALWAATFPLSGLFAPAQSFLVQCLGLGLLVAGGGIVYLAAIELTGAFSYKSLWRAVARS